MAKPPSRRSSAGEIAQFLNKCIVVESFGGQFALQDFQEIELYVRRWSWLLGETIRRAGVVSHHLLQANQVGFVNRNLLRDSTSAFVEVGRFHIIPEFGYCALSGQ